MIDTCFNALDRHVDAGHGGRARLTAQFAGVLRGPGAVHSVVFGGFAPRELALRSDDARPKAVVSASCGIEGSRVIPYKPLSTLHALAGQLAHAPVPATLDDLAVPESLRLALRKES